MASNLQTHTYDHKLISRINNFNVILKNITRKDKFNYFFKLKQLISESQSLEPQALEQQAWKPQALQAIDMIYDNIGNLSNCDQTNNLIADDLLYLICDKLFKDFESKDCVDYDHESKDHESKDHESNDYLSNDHDSNDFESNDYLSLLTTQLSDIITKGSCSQGRCIRLAQIFFIMYE